MKLTTDQEELIGQLLRRYVKYRDTYNEVYDHVLSSLDAMPDDVRFADALRDIVENELGGAKGLKALEKQRIWFDLREFVKEYFNNLLKSFTSIIILPLTVSTYLFYCSIESEWLDQQAARSFVAKTPIVMLCIVSLFFIIKKRSLKQELWPIVMPFRQTMLGFTGIFMVSLPGFFLQRIFSDYLFKDIPAIMFSLIFLVLAIHLIAVCKLLINKKNFEYLPKPYPINQ